MKVKFKQLHKDAVLPSYAKPGDGGLDITSIDNGKVHGSEDGKDLWYYIEYKTGLAAEIPENHVGLLFPRSSISKNALFLTNAVGVLDSGYRGEICFRFRIDSGIILDAKGEKEKPAKYKKGDKIGQLVIVPFPAIEPEFVEELSETERGQGCFGSTGQ